MAELRADHQTRFQSQGLGTKNKQKPVSVMLPEDIDQIIRAMPNRSEFIRQAIIEKLSREQCA
jgi:hypothetical protein